MNASYDGVAIPRIRNVDVHRRTSTVDGDVAITAYDVFCDVGADLPDFPQGVTGTLVSDAGEVKVAGVEAMFRGRFRRSNGKEVFVQYQFKTAAPG